MSVVLAKIPYPNIDPEIFSITIFGSDFALRWYSVAYMLGLIFGWWYIRRQTQKPGAPWGPAHIDDYLTWATLGVVFGGRLGYVMFYNLPYYLQNPIKILYLGDGGMSFHGGLIGVVLALVLFARHHRLPLFKVGDAIAIVAPVGLLAGRLANFINGELWGRATDVPWAMIFPADRLQLPRHPSQLYEALGEGLILLLVQMYLYHRTNIRHDRPGMLCATFFIGYGTARFLVEFVREPDGHLGLMGWISRGQLLTIPMFLFAAWLIYMSRQPNQPFARR